MENKLKVVLYLRYSSHKQNEQSIEGQQRICEDFAKQQGYNIIDIYIDRATSAKTDHRPSFQKMIADAAKNQWDAILVYKLDRFARNRYDSAIYKTKLRKYGVSVLSAMENISDSPEGVILESVLEGMAEYYSADLSQKVTRGMLEGAHKCQTNGVRIYGYTETPDKHYAIDEHAAQAVRTIFKMYTDGEYPKDIIAYLKSNGYKTYEGKDFSYSKIQRILNDERYTGVYKFSDVVISGGMPAIIDTETFNKAKQRAKANQLKKSTQRAKVKYMLTFKLFCGTCGAAMVGESGRSKNGNTYNYYKCSAHKKGSDCKGRTIRKEYIEDVVINEIYDNILMQKNIIEKIAVRISKIYIDEAKQNDNSEHLKKELAETEKSISNLLKAMEQGIITNSTKERLEELEYLKLDLKAALQKAAIYSAPKISNQEIIDYFSDIADGNKTDIKYRQKLVDMFVKSIHLYDDKVIIAFNYGAPTDDTDDDKKSKNKISEIPINISECSDIKSTGTPVKALSEHLFVWNKMLLSIVHLTK